MKIFLKLFLIILSTTIFFSGCRLLPPSDKPFLAVEYLHEAEMAGAAEFAPAEYQRLLQEFSQLEQLHQSHQYDAVDKLLPLFAAQASRLIELTRQNISKTDTLAAPPEVPAPAAPPPPAPSIKETSVATESERIVKPRLSYTVGEGELLWTIAKRADIYGDPLLWPLLYQANRDQIKDPRQIYAGQTLTIPRNVSEEEREEARNRAKKSDFFPKEELMRPPR